MNKFTSTALAASLLLAGVSHAQITVDFTDLNAQLDSTNAVTAGGFTTADAEMSISGAANGNNYLYSVTYTGASYDGDATNDTLTFGVLVEGWDGSAASTNFDSTEVGVNASHGTVTGIGTTDADVILNGVRWSAVNGHMNTGNTLEFSLVNLNVTTSQGSYVASLDSFTGTSYQETGNGFGHVAVIGDVGTGLFDTRFNATNYNIVGLLNETDRLTITSADLESDAEFARSDALFPGSGTTTLNSSNPQRWSVSSLDFGINITAVPEPSSYALLAGLLGMSYVMLRRRQA